MLVEINQIDSKQSYIMDIASPYICDTEVIPNFWLDSHLKGNSYVPFHVLQLFNTCMYDNHFIGRNMLSQWLHLFKWKFHTLTWPDMIILARWMLAKLNTIIILHVKLSVVSFPIKTWPISNIGQLCSSFPRTLFEKPHSPGLGKQNNCTRERSPISAAVCFPFWISYFAQLTYRRIQTLIRKIRHEAKYLDPPTEHN